MTDWEVFASIYRQHRDNAIPFRKSLPFSHKLRFQFSQADAKLYCLDRRYMSERAGNDLIKITKDSVVSDIVKNVEKSEEYERKVAQQKALKRQLQLMQKVIEMERSSRLRSLKVLDDPNIKQPRCRGLKIVFIGFIFTVIAIWVFIGFPKEQVETPQKPVQNSMIIGTIEYIVDKEIEDLAELMKYEGPMQLYFLKYYITNKHSYRVYDLFMDKALKSNLFKFNRTTISLTNRKRK